MTAESKGVREELSSIRELLIEDLLKTSDAELLEEAAKEGAQKGKGLLAQEAFIKAKQTVGARRLTLAKQEMEMHTEHGYELVLDAQAARRIILKLSAANDSQFTLAARNITSISDEEVLELVNELIELGALDKDKDF